MFPRGRSGPQEKRTTRRIRFANSCAVSGRPDSAGVSTHCRPLRWEWSFPVSSIIPADSGMVSCLTSSCVCFTFSPALNVPLSAVVCERVRTANASSPVNTGMEMEAESSHVMTVSLSSYIVYSDAARTVPGLSFT
ncbi:hypothetical protein AcV7_010380 [Taiwanofungus camphoratus]|nr:hypothetical protein AcV7_010380 [Antrodia cinnamomea]